MAVEESVDWHLDLSTVLSDPPLRASLFLEAMPGGILVRGTVNAAARLVCVRCLDEWDEMVEVDVAQLFLTEVDEDTVYAVAGPELDLEPLIRDEVLLAFPLTPTCPEGCRGVVQVTETRLNALTPDELGDVVSPFAVLKDLLDAGE